MVVKVYVILLWLHFPVFRVNVIVISPTWQVLVYLTIIKPLNLYLFAYATAKCREAGTRKVPLGSILSCLPP